ncbi:subtilisin-like serine protease [Coleophoma cylindrospora]|uniref:Subtilisin-like serine protease n=1 Tax=Coleophoma cylindrospora TaxID=1849047 RepID=A0A3D8R0T9_9HELO|nr:subtilisin-like serine protease [Coleophoma cylindrospora]
MAGANIAAEMFGTDVFDGKDATADKLPASYHHHVELENGKKVRNVSDPNKNIKSFLKTELSLGHLDGMQKHLWFAGARHRATQLHFQIAIGREIVISDRMDLHLLWDNRRVFLKPIPRFLLDPAFWKSNLTCPATCTCQNAQQANPRPQAGNQEQPPMNHELPPINHETPPMNNGQPPANQELVPCVDTLRKVAFGFLYSYVCLISSESDFFVANEKRLLPRNEDDATIKWANWQILARELIKVYDPDKVHPRFHRAELRLHRINIIHRFTQLPLFNPYLREWRDYGSLFRENLAWIATTTVFIALVLTAMQVGLATDQLKDNRSYQRASYGFSVFAILGPLCAFGTVALAALYNLVKDLPWLLGGGTASSTVHPPGDTQPNQDTQAINGVVLQERGTEGDGGMV